MSQPKTQPAHKLPPEVLRMCLTVLSSDDQFTALQVSKDWHEVALSVAWKSIKIRGKSGSLNTFDDKKRLNWNSLEKYGHLVRSVDFNWDCCTRSKRPELSEIDIWLKIARLPNLNRLTVHCYNFLNRVNSSVIHDIFSRIRVLKLYVDLSEGGTSAVGDVENGSGWSIEDLLIDCSCDIDIVQFIKRCPLLRVLNLRGVHFRNEDKQQRSKIFKDLVIFLNNPKNVEYLEALGLFVGGGCTEEELAPLLGEMRTCLRSFHSFAAAGLTLFSGLKRHFNTISDITFYSSIPGISSQILTLCHSLTCARLRLFPDDIMDKTPWICKSMISFDVTIQGQYLASPETSIMERTLCTRISELQNLQILSLDTEHRRFPVYNPRKLNAEGMIHLLNLSKLNALNLGDGIFSEIDILTINWLLKFQVLKQISACWERGSTRCTTKLIQQL